MYVVTIVLQFLITHRESEFNLMKILALFILLTIRQWLTKAAAIECAQLKGTLLYFVSYDSEIKSVCAEEEYILSAVQSLRHNNSLQRQSIGRISD
jgi:bisphosphoglycerate-dependent phosphoglycerate mutase